MISTHAAHPGLGRIQDFEKGEAQLIYVWLDYKMYVYCACAKHTAGIGMQSMPNLGGSGGMPGNFEKLHPLRLNLRAF